MVLPPRNFPAVLASHARAKPDATAIRFLEDGQERTLTYAELDRRARAVASRLIRMEMVPGSRALLLAPPGLEFVVGIFACFYAGVVAVPAPPSRSRRSGSRVDALLEDASPVVLLAPAALRARLSLHAGAAEDRALRSLVALPFVDLEAAPEEVAVAPPDVPAEALALLQYTSGSTRRPRGVMLSQENLVTNCERILATSRFTAESRALTWLPPYHDLGLIGTVLAPLLAGAEVTTFSPLAFLARPSRWLRAIDEYAITHSGAPDFAYALCARRVGADEKRDLDLSRWQVAFLGAERIRPETLERFAEAFAECGFRREAFAPGYGLAEATLGVTFAEPGRSPRVLHVDEIALARGEVRDGRGQLRSLSLVSSGRPFRAEEVRIVDPATCRKLGEGRVGEIWVRGPCVARGYWQNEEETTTTFEGRLEGEAERYLRTGDLGFFDGGELFVTGRIKDLLILAGENHHPEDLEHTAANARPDLGGDAFAAFAIEADGRERLVLVHEGTSAGEVGDVIREAIARRHEIEVWDYVVVRKGSLPRTTSGKLQRSLLRERYLEGALPRANAARETPDRASRLEEPIGEVLRELLGLSSVDRNEDFFALGLHSLLATQLVVRLREKLGRDIPLRMVFEAPSVARLATRLAIVPPESPRIPIELREDGDTSALTASQERMWFLHQLDPGGSAYNVAGALGMRGPLDPQALEGALRTVVARHSILRARYLEGVDGPVQRLDVELEVQLPIVSLERERDPMEASRHQMAAFARRPFDLARGPLVRVTLFRRAPDDHVLAVCLHHIVADGWSMNILLEEVLEAYDARVQDRPLELPEIAHSFVSYAQALRRLADEKRLERSLAHYRARLVGAPELLELPTDRPRPPRMTYGGGMVRIALPPALSEALQALGNRHGATRFMVLLAAFKLLLARYTGQTDIVVGTPIAGRTHLESERLVGTLVNMLPLRTELGDVPRFDTLLARVRTTALEAYEHQDMPFERLVEEILSQRAVDRTPIFQVMFDHQTISAPTRAVAGLTFAPERIERGGVQLDLAVSVLDVEGRLEVTAEYRRDLFDRETVERMLASYRSLLLAAVDDPEGDPFLFPLLDDETREALLAIGRGPDRPYAYVSALEPIAAWARAHPDHIAVRDETRSLTRSELERASNAVAHTLAARGIGRGDLVAVCLDRSVSLVATLLGVWKTGAAYVPLDPAYPRERLRMILEDARPKVVITEVDVAEALPLGETGIEAIDLATSMAETRSRSDAPFPSALDGGERAYVMFTSGSTGRPKGVEVTHRNVANLLASMARRLDVREGERLLAVTTFAFDISVLELFLPLATGGEVEIASRRLASNPEALRERLERTPCDWMQATPSTWTMLVDAGWKGSSTLGVLSGGEALSETLAQALLARSRVAFNVYGPTETTVWSTLHRLTTAGSRVPLGEPLDHTSLYVLDPRRQLLPLGVKGELYIGGDGVARGYLGQPSWTAERFIDDPYAPGGRMYRTGDTVRRTSGGELLFLGRGDDQVKLRGHRIELGEIESCLAQHPRVRAAAVLLTSRGSNDARLIAHLTTTDGAPLETMELRTFLAARLPEYMLPSGYVVLTEMPRTANGKLDRRALPTPLPIASSASVERPRTSVERTIAGTFESLLDHPEVGLDDDFFVLGGHSLLAVRVAATLTKALGVRLPLTSFFAAPTVRLLAEAVEQERVRLESEAVELVASHGGEPVFTWVYSPPKEALLRHRESITALVADRRLLALPAPERPYANLASLAADWVAALRLRTAAGPYVLGGIGFGANVAQEMAVQLVALGEEVELLVGIDTLPRPDFLPGRGKRPPGYAEVDAVSLTAWERHRAEPFEGAAWIAMPRERRRGFGFEGAWRKLLPHARFAEEAFPATDASPPEALLARLLSITARDLSRDERRDISRAWTRAKKSETIPE